MIDPRKPAFDAARKVAGKLTERDVDMLHAALDAIKYLTRWRAKVGVQDLRKARHFIDLLIERESGKWA